MSSKEKILSQFKSQLIKFVDELIDQFPNQSNFVIMRILIKDQMNIEDIMKKFINDVLPHKEDIKERNDSFFIKNKFIQTSNGSLFKILWESDNLDDDDRIIIWKWIDLFVVIGKKYLDIK